MFVDVSPTIAPVRPQAGSCGRFMKILVTGATGLTGRALVAVLAGRPRGFRAATVPAARSLAPGVSLDRAGSAGPLGPALLPPSVDAVVHLAQSPRFREFPGGTVDIFEVNSATTVRLLHYCCEAGGTRFVYASSGASIRRDHVRSARTTRLGRATSTRSRSSSANRSSTSSATPHRGHACASSSSMDRASGTCWSPGSPEMFAGAARAHRGRRGIRINPIYVDDAAAAVVGALGLEQSGVFNVAGPRDGLDRRHRERRSPTS